MRNRNKFKNCSSKFIGVNKNGNKWVARISIGKVRKYLGYFDTELEAHLAYEKKCEELMDNKMEEYDEMDNYEPHDF